MQCPACIGTKRPVRNHGKVNILGILMLLGIAAAAYWAVIIGPIYMQRTDVKGEVTVAFNKFGLDKPDNIVQALIIKLNSPEFGKTLAYNEQGVLVEMPGVNITKDDVEFLANDKLKELTIRVHYKKIVKLVPTSKIKTYPFTVEVKGAFAH